MLDKLRVRNDELLEFYKNDPVKVRRLTLIKNILRFDRCFFDMDEVDAYNLLYDLEVRDDKIALLYQELININNYNNIE